MEYRVRLEIAAPGSPEGSTAANDIERLREEYALATEVRVGEAEELSMPPGVKRPKS
jgi:hypothetical protein